ncbi:MAG: AAA family ATPase [Fretibacterium sp.]|nr:AAA family ATPase [Fretibacterium sp.]
MNIAEAKEQIKNAMSAYFSKDEFGDYRIPVEKQRPVFMIGPPGIGKTAIMEQIASELGVGLVSYSMTHHTRQSALGLPYITTKEYGGRQYQVSEYTMSEIIGSVYDLMRETGLKEGILFLDEINCVSETLAPCMLQFLQYKIFGQHRVPEGWILVTAGNPPEYNKSVRDFDIVTWDRLKRIDVEPDYETWRKYAGSKGVHASVMTYLAARKKDFYKVENAADGRHFVTARGWDDLSEMITLYEEKDIPVNEKLIIQYLQDARTAKDFAIYYDLFHRYRSDYQIEAILDGTVSGAIVLRAQQAKMDERLSVLGLLFDGVTAHLKAVCEHENVLDLVMEDMRTLKGAGSPLPVAGKEAISCASGDSRTSCLSEVLRELAKSREEELSSGRRASSLSGQQQRELRRAAALLDLFRAELLKNERENGHSSFDEVRALFQAQVQELRERADRAGKMLDNAFRFCEEAFTQGENPGDEVLLFVTELTSNYYSARFIGHYGCDRYYLHNKELQFQERQQEIERQIEGMDWDV